MIKTNTKLGEEVENEEKPIRLEEDPEDGVEIENEEDTINERTHNKHNGKPTKRIFKTTKFTTNSNDSTRWVWNGNEWKNATEGIYPAGYWRLYL